MLAGALAAIALSASSCTEHVEPARPTSCAADSFESNDTPETAHELPPLKDEKRSTADIVDLTVHSTRDEDWFRIPVKDTGWTGNPVITAMVSSTSFDVATWFICDEGGTPNSLECRVGSKVPYDVGGGVGYDDGCLGVDSEDEDVGTRVNFAVSSTDCSGTSDDNGTLYVRVRHKAPLGPSPSESEALTWECNYALSLLVE